MPQKAQSIIVFRALKLGDMLCSVPALRALRKIFPTSKISLVTHPAMEILFKRYTHYIDEFIPFPGFPGFPELNFKASRTLNFLQEIQKKKFDVAIQLHGSGEISNSLVSLFEADKVLGFTRPGKFCPDEKGYFYYPDHLHEIHRCLSLMQFMSNEKFSDELEFTVLPCERGVLQKLEIQRPFFCLHPGASSENKRWSPLGFANVADMLREKGFEIVFTGTKGESNLINKIQKMMKHSSINIADLDLPIGSLAEVIESSRGLICNDTGVSHLAVALKVKSVVLFTETNPERWAPLNSRRHISLRSPSIQEVIESVESIFMEEATEVL